MRKTFEFELNFDVALARRQWHFPRAGWHGAVPAGVLFGTYKVELVGVIGHHPIHGLYVFGLPPYVQWVTTIIQDLTRRVALDLRWRRRTGHAATLHFPMNFLKTGLVTLSTVVNVGIGVVSARDVFMELFGRIDIFCKNLPVNRRTVFGT